MKKYINPEIQYVLVNVADLLTLSSETDDQIVYSERFGSNGIIGI